MPLPFQRLQSRLESALASRKEEDERQKLQLGLRNVQHKGWVFFVGMFVVFV